MTYREVKEKVFEIIQPSAEGKLASRLFDLFIMFLILVSVASVFIMTFEGLPHPVSRILRDTECITILIFTVEYILRIWTADLLYPDFSPWQARLKFVCSPMALIDLAAILPFYLPVLFSINLVGIRMIRLVRLLRIFKLNRYSDAFVSILEVFRGKIREILVSLFIVLLLLIIASLLIFYAEHDAQPQQFSNAFSGLWWAVATLTTVGYGDIYPVTPVGRILGAIIALLGIGMAAVPTSILSAGFVELLEKRKAEERKSSAGQDKPEEKEPPVYCPHCGKKL